MGRFYCTTPDNRYEGYLTITSDGYFKLTKESSAAAEFNAFDQEGRHYFMVAAGPWAHYYLSSHWDKGLCLYSKWGDAAYFRLWNKGLYCCSHKSANHRAALCLSNGFVYCYNDSPEQYVPLNVTWDPFSTVLS